MKTIRGEYENGVIKLLDEAPSVKNSKVLVTFFIDQENEEEIIRNISLHQSSNFFNEYLKDEREDLYQEYLNADK